jgi:hypothetical protein
MTASNTKLYVTVEGEQRKTKMPFPHGGTPFWVGRMYTKVNKGKVYPYNSKKRGWYDNR